MELRMNAIYLECNLSRFNNNNNDLIIMKSLFRCQVFELTMQRPCNWGHHLYHSKMDGDLSYFKHYVFLLPEKTVWNYKI